MADFTDLAARYIDVWNESDPALRAKAIAGLLTEDARYVDPLADVQGHDGMAAVVEGAQQMFPGHRFRLAGPVDAHHDQARFTWELVPDGGDEATVAGFDVVVASGDGRLRRIYGFLDKVPA